MGLKNIWGAGVSIKGAVLVALTSLAIGLGISGSLDWLAPSRAVNLLGEAGPDSRSFVGLPDFVNLAKKIKPIVVNISTTQMSEARGGPQEFSSPFGEEDPFNDFWRRFFGGPQPRGPQRQRSLGSGFIIDSDGSILTNQHLVGGAKKILVKLSNGKELEAKVIGQDNQTDIALIKIKTGESLIAAPLGDSDRLEVGEWVMAIGNPFGLDNSVTSGIVSAKGRFLGTGPYDDFIQTDASVNPGNSGGPLVNLRGEVVGINTAIVSNTGANIGIGFALPINLVKELLPQLKKAGKITRGWLGVNTQRLTPEIAESLGINGVHGALVSEVSKDGPAHRAGIRPADVIIEFDGHPVKDARALPLIVAREPVDRKTQVKILRDKKQLTLNVTIGELRETGATKRREELG